MDFPVCQNYTDRIPKGLSLPKLLSFLPQWEMKSIEYKLVKLNLSNFQENHFSTIKQRHWNCNGLRRNVTKCTWLHENKNLIQKISTTEWSTVLFPWRQNSTTILIHHYGFWTVTPTPVPEPIGDEIVDWTNSIKVQLLSEDCHEFMDVPWTQQTRSGDYFTVAILVRIPPHVVLVKVQGR